MRLWMEGDLHPDLLTSDADLLVLGTRSSPSLARLLQFNPKARLVLEASDMAFARASEVERRFF